MAGSFRFLHASDFHLDLPPGGLTELPDALMDPLIDATYKSVDRVFDAALQERVDFMVLCGDLIHFPTASPKAVAFLHAQMARLSDQKIPVYWLGGQLEAGHPLPHDFVLPKHVHRFPSSRAQQVEVKRDAKTIAYVIGQSASGDAFVDLKELRCPRDGRFFVGLWYGNVERDADADQLDDLGIDYWAFGGRHNPRRFDTTIPAEYSGTPQGRLPAEHGPHGCTLVKVNGNSVDTHFIETDAIRYQTEQIVLREGEGREVALRRTTERFRELQTGSDGSRHLLVTWEFVDDGPLGRELRQLQGAERFLAEVQRETHLKQDGKIWSTGVESSRATIPSSLFDEDSILGDYLRVVRDLEQSSDRILDVHAYLPNTPAANRLAEALHLDDAAARRRLLREVTTVGIDMLSGE